MPPKLAANIDWLFTDLPPLERVAAAAAHGLRGIEILFPYGIDADALTAEIEACGLEVALINSPPGDWAAGERGLALSDDEGAFRSSIDQAASLAARVGCERVHVLSGIGDLDSRWERYIERMRWAAQRLADDGITMCLEPINATDMPGYALNTPGQAVRVLDAIDHPSARLQLDLYHTWVTEGAVEPTLTDVLPRVAHVQIAGVPERNEPDRGDLRLEPILARLTELDYDGWVGLEYRPRGDTSTGLQALLAGLEPI